MIRKIPFFRLLIFLIIGISCAYYFSGSYRFFFLGVLVASSLAILVFNLSQKLYRNYRFRWSFGLFIFLFLFSTGWLVTDMAIPSRINSDFNVSAKGEVVSVEDAAGKWTKVIFKPSAVNNDTVPLKPGDLWLLLVDEETGSSNLLPGFGIEVKGVILRHNEPSNPGAFDYGDYLFRQGIAGQMFVNKASVLVVNDVPAESFQILSSKIRTWCIDVFSDSGINGTNLALLNALVLGERKGIDRELNEKFIRSGAIHLLAVSGLHVGIVFLLLNFILSLFLKSTSIFKLVLSVGFLFFYAFITGFSPSVTRAVVMFSLIQTGIVYARHINIYNILCVSAFVILLWNPMFLFHAGFWLSHLAVAGIVAFYPIINGWLNFSFIGWRWIWSLISVAIAAQITTIPLSLWLFGAFPSYFLLSNLFLLPLIAPILIMAFILLMFSGSSFISNMLGAPLSDLLGFMQDMVGFIEALPNAYISGIWVTVPLLVSLYLLIYYWYQYSESRYPRLAIKVVAIVTSIVFVITLQWSIKSNKSSFVVYDATRESLIQVINKGECITFLSEGITQTQRMFVSGAFERHNVLRHHQSVYFKVDTINHLPDVYRIEMKDKSYCMIYGGNGILSDSINFNTNVLVISGTPSFRLDELVQKLGCKTIVFGSNCPPWKVRNWLAQLKDFNDLKIHDVKTMGAYID